MTLAITLAFIIILSIVFLVSLFILDNKYISNLEYLKHKQLHTELFIKALYNQVQTLEERIKNEKAIRK
jgi:hypothetical protein